MDRITVHISRDAEATHSDVARALEAVWNRIGRQEIDVYFDDRTGTWVPEEFELVAVTFQPPTLSYHPWGRRGQVAEFIAQHTGGTLTYPETHDPPGRVY